MILKFFLKQVLYMTAHNPNSTRKELSQVYGAPSYSTICRAIRVHKDLGYILEEDRRLTVAKWLGIAEQDPISIKTKQKRTLK